MMQLQSQPQFSKALLDMLTEFMVNEIGSKALDGITYTMILKNPNNTTIYNRYISIKKEANNCGFSNDEVFRVYELQNGYIFDMDINAVKQITVELAKAVSKQNGGTTPAEDLVKDMPEQRRKKDMVNLARYLKSEYDKGKLEIEVALFSRNSTNRIIINGKSSKGEQLVIKYNAYVLRHWDIEFINEKFLIPSGFRVRSIQPCEILPTKTGVSFKLRMESMDQYRESLG